MGINFLLCIHCVNNDYCKTCQSFKHSPTFKGYYYPENVVVLINNNIPSVYGYSYSLHA